MTEYVNLIMSLQYRLCAMGYGLEDKFLAIVMLSGLSKEYEPIVMGFENDDLFLTSDKARARLLQHELQTNGSDTCMLARSRN